MHVAITFDSAIEFSNKLLVNRAFCPRVVVEIDLECLQKSLDQLVILARYLGAVDGGPRVLYDPAADRYAVVATTPADPGGPTVVRLAVTRSGDPCGGR